MVENTLFDDNVYETNIKNAKERVKQAMLYAERLNMGKVFLGFSGGKDSECIYFISKMVCDEMGKDIYDVIDIQYNITNLDPPELVRFIRKEFPRVHMKIPKTNFWNLMVLRKAAPTRHMRFCCAELKEVSSKGRVVITGVRRAESVKRSKRKTFENNAKVADRLQSDKTMDDVVIKMNDNSDNRRQIEHCLKTNGYIINPIIDWDDAMVWEFIKKNNYPYCELYDKGWKRLGCIGCCLKSPRERERDFKVYPKYYEQYMRTFQKVQDARKQAGKNAAMPNSISYDAKDYTAENLMKYYMSEDISIESEDGDLFND